MSGRNCSFCSLIYFCDGSFSSEDVAREKTPDIRIDDGNILVESKCEKCLCCIGAYAGKRLERFSNLWEGMSYCLRCLLEIECTTIVAETGPCNKNIAWRCICQGIH